MNPGRRAWTLGTAALALAAFGAGIHFSRRPASTMVGPMAEGAVERLFATTLPSTSGQVYSLHSARGRPLIVNFWATWCAPCLEEMPVLSKLQEDHPEISVIGIAADIDANVMAFALRNRVSYTLLLGANSSFPLMTDLGNTRQALPFTVVLDGAGNPIASVLGGLSKPAAEKIAALLTQHR